MLNAGSLVSGEYRTNYLNSYSVREKSRGRYQGGIPEGWLITACDPPYGGSKCTTHRSTPFGLISVTPSGSEPTSLLARPRRGHRN